MKRILFFLLLIAPFFASAQVGSPFLQRIFNVKFYGAKGDGSTDDTGPIQRAINACDAAGGGTVWFPNGIYIINGALVTSDNHAQNPNSQIYIPGHPASDGHHSSIKLQGEASTQEFFNFFGSPLPTIIDGVVIRSTLTSASGTRPGIFGTIGASGGFNNTMIEFHDMIIEAYTNSGAASPVLTPLSFYNGATVSLYNVSVRLDVDLVSSVTPGEVAGVIIGHATNNGPNIIQNVGVNGYKYGFMLSEHTTLIGAYAIGDYYGYVIQSTSFPICGQILIHGCPHGIWFQDRTVMGISRQTAPNIPLSPVSLIVENEVDTGATFSGFWFATVDQIIDSSSLGSGTITYQSVGGGSFKDLNNYIIVKGNAYHLNVLTPGFFGVKSSRIQNLGTINETVWGNNIYYDSAAAVWRYVNTAAAGAMQSVNGDFFFSSWGSGTANASAGAPNNWVSWNGTTGAINLKAYTGSLTGTPATLAGFDASGNLIQLSLSGAGLPVDYGSSYYTAGFAIRQGDLTIQSNDVSNTFIGANTQIIGGAYKSIKTAAASYLDFQNGNMLFGVAPSISAGSSQSFSYPLQVNANGTTFIGGNQTGSPVTWTDFAKATSSFASVRVTPSSAVDPSTIVRGMLWDNGTNLYYGTGSGTKIDLLAGGISIPGANTNIIFNNSGALGANSGFTYDPSGGGVTLTKNQASFTLMAVANSTASGSEVFGLTGDTYNNQLVQYNSTHAAYGASIANSSTWYSNGTLMVIGDDNASPELQIALGTTTPKKYSFTPTVFAPAATATADLGTSSIAWRQLFLGAGTTTTTQINLAAGTAKTSPAQGDLFATNGHLYYRDGSTTYDLLAAGSSTSNTFTSTLTNTTNIASNSFLSANYIQVGNIVHCRIGGTMTPTAGGSASTMTFTLPVSTATTTQSRVGAGSYFNSSNIPQGVLVDIVSGTTGTITFFPTNTGTGDWAIEFDYKTN